MAYKIISSILIAGGAALQISESGGVCGPEKTAFEAISNKVTDTCTVYCVPEGQCLGRAQAGMFTQYGIIGEGNCKHLGYNETMPLDPMTNATATYLERTPGPCTGMQVFSFKRPAGRQETAVTNGGHCGPELRPYEAISAKYPGLCSMFCVPEGECEFKAQVGGLQHFGITGEGNCKSKGYTKPASFGEAANLTVKWLKAMRGVCGGMTFGMFVKPFAAETPAEMPAQTPAQTPVAAPEYWKGKNPMPVREVEGILNQMPGREVKGIPNKGPQGGDGAVAPPNPVGLCGEETTPFEAVNALTGECSVYCVPHGQCLGMAQLGMLKSYGITGEGNCKSRGYTDAAPPDARTNATAKFLAHLTGPCTGMTIRKFQMPANPVEEASGHCGQEQTPYEAISAAFPNVCSVYCVPQGECELQAQTGFLYSLGITAQGDCRSKGYTKPAGLGLAGNKTAQWLKMQPGPCRGMRLAKFEKPVAAGPTEQPVAAAEQSYAVARQKSVAEAEEGTAAMCGKEAYPFEGFNAFDPDTCLQFCVPEGECLGRAQEGRLRSLGIHGEGNCRSRGYTESAPHSMMANATAHYLANSAGPCTGMTFQTLRKPAGPTAAAAASSSHCGRDQTAYEAISPLYPGVCSVYCVPEGECRLQAQIGKLSHYGITGEGNCKSKGFTKAASLGSIAQRTVEGLKHLQGACMGMTLMKFERPQADAPQVDAAGTNGHSQE